MTPGSAWSFGEVAGPVACTNCAPFQPHPECVKCQGSGVEPCAYCGDEPGIHQDHDGLACPECHQTSVSELVEDERAAA